MIRKITIIFGLSVACSCFSMHRNRYERSLHAAIDALDVHTVKEALRQHALLEWKDQAGKNSFDHVDEIAKKEFSIPYNFSRKKRIAIIRKSICERRDQLLYWKIKYPDLALVKLMVSLGAWPHYVLPNLKMTALCYAQSLVDSPPAELSGQRKAIYSFLKKVDDNRRISQATKTAHYEGSDKPVAPDDNHLEILESLATEENELKLEPFKFFVTQ